VIRGEEWLPSLPLHHLLYKAFGWEEPEFAHLPLILKPNGKGKLSKRDGEIGGFPVFPLQWKDLKGFKEEGYFPEALINMLVMLGWNEGSGIEKEIYSLKELESKFLLENVTKSGGKFNPEKAKWYNQQYLQLEDNEVLALIFKEILSEKNITVSDYKLKKIIELTKDRAIFINDFWEINNYIFQRPMSYDNKALEKNWKENTTFLMINLLDILEKINEFKQSEIEREVKDWIKNNQYSFGQIMAPFRISLVGELKGIDLFVLCELIGKKEVIERIENVIKLIELK